MTVKFDLNPVNGQQLIPINGGAVGSHLLYLIFATNPTAGTVTVEWRRIGGKAWRALKKVTAVSVTPGELEFRIDGPVAELRVTFSGLTGGTLPQLWLEKNAGPEKLYQGFAAMTVQNYISANVKNGAQFEASGLALAVAAGTITTITFKTGAKDVLIKGRQISFTGPRITGEIRKGVVYTAATGTLIPSYNMSDINVVASTVEVRLGATITTIGTVMGAPVYGIGSDTQGNNTLGGFVIDGVERQLKANSTYSLTINNNHTAAINLATYLTWYEGSPDLPL